VTEPILTPEEIERRYANDPAEVRAFHDRLALENEIAEAATLYSRAVIAQLTQAEAAGGWPEKLTLKEPVTPAEREAFDLVLANLQKQLPGTKIMVAGPGNET